MLGVSPGVSVWYCYLPFGREREAIPDSSHHHLPREAKEGLRYLAKFSIKVYCPYTEGQAKIFQESYEADLRTRRWLQIGLFVTTFLTLATFLPIVSANYEISSLSKTALFVGVIASAVNNVVSFIATGTNPHYASCIANEAQEATQEVIDFYGEEMATALIEMELVEAKEIAKGLQASKEGIQGALVQYHPKITPYQKGKMISVLYKAVDKVTVAELDV